MLNFNLKYWIKFIIFNFLCVASLGVLMRYKIGFEFPFFDQQNIQHAHSNFAFTGWISQTLFILIISCIMEQLTDKQLRKYQLLLWLNLICSYGMLIMYMFYGYNFLSISFSTFAIFIQFAFTISFFKNAKTIKHNPAVKWFKAGLIFALLSYIGTLSIIVLMYGKHIYQNWYLASVYFFLHFQYNGWFFFTCIALFITKANLPLHFLNREKWIFKALVIACVPAYFLSTLWAPIPSITYISCLIAAIVQFIAWIYLVKMAHKILKDSQTSVLTKFLFYFVAIAGSSKFLLQLGSTIPSISHLAFGFRPIVIAYLHLVLLGFISMMLILYLYLTNIFIINKTTMFAIIAIAVGILLNEMMLAIQGIASLSYMMVPYCNIILFAIAILLWLSIFWLFLSQFKNKTTM